MKKIILLILMFAGFTIQAQRYLKITNPTNSAGSSFRLADNDNFDVTASQSKTITFKMRISATNPINFGRIVQKINGTSPVPQYGMSLGSATSPTGIANGYRFTTGNSATTYGSVNVAVPTLTDGNWHHIVMVLNDANNLFKSTFYIDGTLVYTTTAPAAIEMANGGLLAFGSTSSGGSVVTMDIDDIRFYNASFTASDIITDRITTLVNGSTPNILAAYDFEGGSVATSFPDVTGITNVSGTAIDGTGTDNTIALVSGSSLPLNIWTGITNTSWTSTSNWSQSSLPISTSDVTIGTATNQPSIATDVSVNSLAIASGATLTVNEGKVLEVSGTITNSGDLILKSSATGTASLLNTSAAPNVTQQRYLSSNQRGWRLLSNPLTSTTFNALASASGITIGTNYTGEYLSASNTWTSTDGSAAMDNQKAYKVFITGLTGEAPAYTTGPSNVTLVNKGTAANTVPVAIAATTGEFYLLANPYTAPISLKTILDANAFLSKTVSYYDSTVGSTDVKIKFGGYTTKDTSTTAASGDANDVVIPPMGAIFVQASSAGSITVPKTAIFTGTNNSGTYTHKTAQTKVASTNALKIEVSSSGVYYDALALQFKAVGDAGSNIDFGKLPNTILDAYSFAGSNKMAVSELELAAQTIPLGITSTIQKNYTFKVVDNTIPAGYEAVLVDNVLNTSTVLTTGTSYNFAIDSNPASQGDARFAINLKTAGTLGVKANELDASIQVYPNPSRGQFNITNTLNQKEDATIEISNLNGQVIHAQKLNSGTTTIQTKTWATGVYILKATNNGTQTTKKLIIQ